MIVVIADDFSGAAEMCGVALRYNLSSEVQIEPNLNSAAKMLSIDTDTRTCTPAEASSRLKDLGKRLTGTSPHPSTIPPSFYKKIDSALRGPLLFEVKEILSALTLPRSLLVPANPGLGRVIREGHYFVDGRPIHQTDFGKDPHFAHHSSKVADMLAKPKSFPVNVLPPRVSLPQAGVTLGEAASEADLITWAGRVDRHTLPGGAAEFFAKFLEYKAGFRKGTGDPIDVLPQVLRLQKAAQFKTLFVCGSASSYAHLMSRDFEVKGIPVLRIPEGLFDVDPKDPEKLVSGWAADALQALSVHPRVLVTIDRPFSKNPELSTILTDHMGELVRQILRQGSVNHICVDGGATASSLVRRMDWKGLRAVHEFAPGVVCMEVRPEPRLFLTAKPGTYRWPEVLMG